MCNGAPEESIEFPGTEVIDSQEPLCGYWEQNPVPLQKKPVILSTKPSLQVSFWIFACNLSTGAGTTKPC